MKKLSKPIKFWLLAFALTVSLTGLLWGQYRFYMQRPDGDQFLSHWVAARAFLLDDVSPYSKIVAARIQTMAAENQVNLVNIDSGMVDPIYVELLFIPFALIENYLLARFVWMLVLELALIAAVWLSLRILDWQPKKFLLAAFFAFAIIWYPAVRAVSDGSLSIIIALLIIAALAAIRSQRDELAGFLLALSTMQPRMVIPLIFLVVLWAIFQRRRRLLIWLSGSWFLLILLGMLLMPTWHLQYIGELLSYLHNKPPATIQAALVVWLPGVGQKLSKVASVLVMVALLWGWWTARKQPFRVLLWTACLTITLTLWITDTSDSGMLVVLVIIFALIFSMWSMRWPQLGPWWSALSMLILSAGSWALFLNNSETGEQLQYMIFSLPALLLMALIWVRWWYVRFFAFDT